jgi:hypothetical protein
MSQPAPPPGAVSEPPGCRGAARLARRVIPGPADPRRGAGQDPATGDPDRPSEGELEREGLAFFRGLLVALVLSAVAYAVIALIVLAAVKLPR